MARNHSFSLIAAVFLFFTAAFAVNAAPAKYTRGGKIIATEKISRPAITMPLDLPENPVFITVTIQPDKNRKFSIVDYSLEVMNLVKVPCIAIKTGEGGWITEESEIDPEGAAVTLLFAAPAKDCVNNLPATVKLFSGTTEIPGGAASVRPVMPIVDNPDNTVKNMMDNDAYIFFEVEYSPVFGEKDTELTLNSSQYILKSTGAVPAGAYQTFAQNPEVRCIAVKVPGSNYKTSAKLKKGFTATLLFAVKAEDCIEDLPFTLHYNLVTTGSTLTLL